MRLFCSLILVLFVSSAQGKTFPPPLAITSPTAGGTASSTTFYAAGTCNPAGGTVVVSVWDDSGCLPVLLCSGNATVDQTGNWTYVAIGIQYSGPALVTVSQPTTRLGAGVLFTLSSP